MLTAGLVMLSLGIWCCLPSPERDILVLDNTALTVVLDELPVTEQDAIALAREQIDNATGVPDRSFSRYFRPRNVSRTPHQWQLAYNVTDNPDLSVSLVQRITPEEAFDVSDEQIIKQVGAVYFAAHFTPEQFDSSANTAHYSFTYPLSAGGEELALPMWLKLSYDRTVISRQVVTAPQEVEMSRAQALGLARLQGLPEPLAAYPVLRSGVICWRVVRQHTPTEQDYEIQGLYGVDIHCTTGEVMGTHRYVRPEPASPAPIQVSQISTLLEQLDVTTLEDGACFEVRVLNSGDEVFAVTKSFGRLVVQEGEQPKNSDLTLWLDRELIVHALKADDTLAYLRNHTGGGAVRAELHKNVAVLQKKGYVQLYERLKP